MAFQPWHNRSDTEWTGNATMTYKGNTTLHGKKFYDEEEALRK